MAQNYKHYFDFQPNPDQLSAFDAIRKFIADPEMNAFILTGHAGTGKTTLIKSIVRYLETKEYEYKLLASTGRAAKVLADKVKKECSTVHGLIYTFKDLDKDLDKVNEKVQYEGYTHDSGVQLLFDLKPKEISDQTTIYIVDEASMIGDSIDKFSSFAQYGSGRLLSDFIHYDPLGKFIFVGDPMQLPPINERESPALSRKYLEDIHDLNVQSAHLKSILRQDPQNDIIKAAEQLKLQYSGSAYGGKWTYFHFSNYYNINIYSDDTDMLADYFQHVIAEEYEKAKLICQSNKICFALNTLFRDAMKRPKKKVCEGDLMLITQNNLTVKLMNGDIVKIIDIGRKEQRADLTFVDVSVVNIISQEIHDLKLIESIPFSGMTNISRKEHTALFIDFNIRMRRIGVKQKSDQYNDLMKKDPYLNALRAVFAYATTCHKSQGGEWDDVFIYLNNSIQSIPRPGVYKWMYTAVTRARKRVHISENWYIK